MSKKIRHIFVVIGIVLSFWLMLMLLFFFIFLAGIMCTGDPFFYRFFFESDIGIWSLIICIGAGLCCLPCDNAGNDGEDDSNNS